MQGENCLKTFLEFNKKILTNNHVYRNTYVCVMQKTKNEVVFRDPYAHILSDPYSQR